MVLSAVEECVGDFNPVSVLLFLQLRCTALMRRPEIGPNLNILIKIFIIVIS